MDPVTLLGLIAPLFVQGGKAAISRWLAPKEFVPSTLDEWTAMHRLDLDRFKALNDAGGTNPTYAWVEAAIRLQRPVVVWITLMTWVALHLAPLFDVVVFSTNYEAAVNNMAATVMFYLFGERTMLGTPVAGNSGVTPLTQSQDAARSTLPTIPSRR